MKEPPKIEVPIYTTLTLLLLDAEEVDSDTIVLSVKQAKEMQEQANRSCLWLAWQQAEIRRLKDRVEELEATDGH